MNGRGNVCKSKQQSLGGRGKQLPVCFFDALCVFESPKMVVMQMHKQSKVKLSANSVKNLLHNLWSHVKKRRTMPTNNSSQFRFDCVRFFTLQCLLCSIYVDSQDNWWPSHKTDQSYLSFSMSWLLFDAFECVRLRFHHRLVDIEEISSIPTPNHLLSIQDKGSAPLTVTNNALYQINNAAKSSSSAVHVQTASSAPDARCHNAQLASIICRRR